MESNLGLSGSNGFSVMSNFTRIGYSIYLRHPFNINSYLRCYVNRGIDVLARITKERRDIRRHAITGNIRGLVAGLSIEVAVIEEHKRRHVQRSHDDECGREQLFFIHAARISGDAYLIISIYIFCILILSIFLAGEREVSHAKDKTNAAYRTDMTHASDECEPAKRHMEPIPSGLE